MHLLQLVSTSLFFSGLVAAQGASDRVAVKRPTPRELALRIVTVQAKNAACEDVLDAVADAFGLSMVLIDEMPDPVTLRVRGVPLSELWDRLGVRRYTELPVGATRDSALDVVPGASEFPVVAHTPGVSFRARRTYWRGTGSARGTVLEIEPEATLWGDVAWDVASVASEGERVPFEIAHEGRYCRLLVRGVEREELVVKLTGTKHFLIEKRVAFKSPKAGMKKKLGRMTFALDWPDVVVRSKQAIPEGVLAQCLREHVQGDVTLRDARPHLKIDPPELVQDIEEELEPDTRWPPRASWHGLEDSSALDAREAVVLRSELRVRPAFLSSYKDVRRIKSFWMEAAHAVTEPVRVTLSVPK